MLEMMKGGKDSVGGPRKESREKHEKIFRTAHAPPRLTIAANRSSQDATGWRRRMLEMMKGGKR